MVFEIRLLLRSRIAEIFMKIRPEKVVPNLIKILQSKIGKDWTTLVQEACAPKK